MSHLANDESAFGLERWVQHIANYVEKEFLKS